MSIDAVRDVMPYDVAIIGAGPAGLAAAIRLKQKQPELSICVLEKAATLGGHSLAGAVIETGPLDALLPDWRDNPPAPCIDVTGDQFRLLNAKGSRWLPVPPQAHNKGNKLISLGSLVAWLGAHAEALGVEVFPGFPAQSALIENGRVIGIRTNDMGRDKAGEEKPGFCLGVDIHAKVTLLAEGCRGSISQQLIQEFDLDKNAAPQTYGIGLKELWRVPEGRSQPGLVQHTIGWPLDKKTYGGSFIYHLDDNRIAIGFVVGLDYQDPRFSPFKAFQQFKSHPDIESLLTGGEILSAGARALVEGGWQSLPTMEMPGAILLGDSAGLLNVPKIKGVHTAMQSGMLAADQIATQWQSEAPEAGTDAVIRASSIGKELKKARHIRGGFRHGLWGGLWRAAWHTMTGGIMPARRLDHADHEATLKLADVTDTELQQNAGSLAPKDRLESVYFAATSHDEDQPVHLQVADTNLCVDRCTEEYGNPCTNFCPANVYEMVEDDDGRRLQINAANCVHCKTCDIKDPYQQIHWTTPESGSGPNYQNL